MEVGGGMGESISKGQYIVLNKELTKTYIFAIFIVTLIRKSMGFNRLFEEANNNVFYYIISFNPLIYTGK